MWRDGGSGADLARLHIHHRAAAGASSADPSRHGCGRVGDGRRRAPARTGSDLRGGELGLARPAAATSTIRRSQCLEQAQAKF